jgi:uncharacterized repeat protein (TIGR03843 family)
MDRFRPAVAGELELLAAGEIEVLGHIPYSSNYVFLARVTGGGSETLSIYKPRKGERPLWDFPSGTLAAREVAAFEVSEAAGWGMVPPTVLRDDAPLGPGSLQLFIDHDPERHYFTIAEGRLEEFVTLAAFDVVINNADRKAGHVLEDSAGKLWAVDHGVAFNVEPKLRTVIWDLAGRPLDGETSAGLHKLASALGDKAGLGGTLARLLSPREATATHARAVRLLDAGALPFPANDHHVPWPLI